MPFSYYPSILNLLLGRNAVKEFDLDFLLTIGMTALDFHRSAKPLPERQMSLQRILDGLESKPVSLSKGVPKNHVLSKLAD